jgi:hypothetical protein
MLGLLSSHGINETIKKEYIKRKNIKNEKNNSICGAIILHTSARATGGSYYSTTC